MHVSLQDGSLQSDWMREYKLPKRNGRRLVDDKYESHRCGYLCAAASKIVKQRIATNSRGRVLKGGGSINIIPTPAGVY